MLCRRGQGREVQVNPPQYCSPLSIHYGVDKSKSSTIRCIFSLPADESRECALKNC